MKHMLIFDFDNTIIDADSDEWIADQFGAAQLFHGLRRQGTPWNDAVNLMLAALHAQGVTVAHIQEALCRIPLRPETIHALQAAHRLGCELRILSDANTFFINAVLVHHGLSNLFSHIHTNPFWVDAHGCCHVGSFHSAGSPSSSLLDGALLPHSCPLCPPNLCKGRVIDAIRGGQALVQGEQPMVQIMYAGDGIGDVCPSLRLTSQDCVLARSGYPLAELLAQRYLAMVKVRVHTWDSLAAGMKEGLHTVLGMSEYDEAAARELEKGAASMSTPCGASALHTANL